MSKKIFFVKASIEVWVPVCSRTGAEAEAIAIESITDVFDLNVGEGGLQKQSFVSAEFHTDVQPPEVADDATVWGEAVPEEFDEVAALRAHLEGK